MDQIDTAIPIVFIRDSKHFKAEQNSPGSAWTDTADQNDKAGTEEVIEFFTQYRTGG